jgi:hypothetical protein
LPRATGAATTPRSIKQTIHRLYVLTLPEKRGDWFGAASLVARILVFLGLGLALLGLARAGMIAFQSRGSLETLATIEAASSRLGGGGLVELSWQEPGGAMRHAAAVPVSRALGRKLRIGNSLGREKLRIRYRPGPQSPQNPVMVVDDLPEQVRSAASLAIGGCLAVTAGSLLVLALLLWRRRSGDGSGTDEDVAISGFGGSSAP